MVDRNGARALVVKYHRDRDERLIPVLAHALQRLHGGETAEALMLEIQLMNELIDSYENLGRFEEAALVKLSRVSVVHQHQLATGGIKVTTIREAA